MVRPAVMPMASRILITPMWAKPLAAPPPRAIPTLTGGGVLATTLTGARTSGALAQAASRLASRAAAKARGIGMGSRGEGGTGSPAGEGAA